MILWLYPWLSELASGFNIFRYISFRAALAAITAFLLSLLVGPGLLRVLRSRQVGERVGKEDCPGLRSLHKGKEGTPTMGGLLRVGGVVISCLAWADLGNRFMLLLLASTAWLGAIGFVDDVRKLRGGPRRGIRPRTKLIGQVLLGVGLGLYLYLSPARMAVLWGQEVVGSDYEPFITGELARSLTVPFWKNVFIPLGWLYVVFVMLVVVGASNAVNLTDGLDGLAAGTSMFVAVVFGIIAYVVGNWKIAQYLAVPFVEGAGELTVYCAALTGAMLGFLWFNTYPAQVFMGDTGSLAVGGGLGLVAVITKQELLLVIAGGIFVAEAVSVIIQVCSFRWRGKRVFLVAPVHHHFELKGLAEPKVVVRFWIIAAVLAVLALSTLKIR